MKYLERYSAKFTLKNFNMVMFLYLVSVVTQAGIGTYYNTHHYIGYAGKYTTPFNVLVCTVVIIFYAMSIVMLKTYERVSDEVIQVMKITKVYMYLFVGCQVSALLYQIILHTKNIQIDKSTQTVLQNLLGLVPSFVGWANAISFLYINQHAKVITVRLIGLAWFKTFKCVNITIWQDIIESFTLRARSMV